MWDNISWYVKRTSENTISEYNKNQIMKNHKKKKREVKWRWWKTGENFYYHFVLRENINFHCSDLLYSRWLQPLSNIHVIIRLSERNTSAIVFMKSTLLEFSMILEGKLDREGTLAGTKWYCENYDYWSKENFHWFKKMFVKNL